MPDDLILDTTASAPPQPEESQSAPVDASYQRAPLLSFEAYLQTKVDTDGYNLAYALKNGYAFRQYTVAEWERLRLETASASPIFPKNVAE